MAYVDGLIGEILKRLEEMGPAHRTLVILTADHGEALFEHGYIGHNTQLYEESIRVPLMMSLPGLTPRRVPDVVELIDIAPTVLQLVGLEEHPARKKMQGRSLVPLLQGSGLADKPAFSRTLWNKPRYSLRGARFKLIWDSRTDTAELYDLSSDALEKVDVLDDHRVVAGFFRQRIYQWLREQEHLRTGAPAPESALVPEDLLRELGAIGYAPYVEDEKKNKK
jgi:arylsulfatase A-like enzyme